jgi:CDP-glucose 4,6-dehydratase
MGQLLSQEQEGVNGEAFNLGPNADVVVPVSELLRELSRVWVAAGQRTKVEQRVGVEERTEANWEVLSEDRPSNGVHHSKSGARPEATLLKLNCDKALHLLSWRPTLTFAETVAYTGRWYRNYYSDLSRARELSFEQIDSYQQLALERNLSWATSQYTPDFRAVRATP